MKNAMNHFGNHRASRYGTAVWMAASVGLLISACSESPTTEPSPLTPDRLKESVGILMAAREDRVPIPPLTLTFGPFSVEDAYRIQDGVKRGLENRLGRVAGYKVAYASKPVQEQNGINEPASAPLFRLQQVASGTAFPIGDFLNLSIETEVAFTIGKRIDHPVPNVEALKPFVRWVHASFDIGEDRFDNTQARPVAADQIAGMVSGHRFLIGPAHETVTVDVDAVVLTLTHNGAVVAEAPATNVMGSPWNSLQWLANHLVKRGSALEPGDVVLSGTASPAYKVSKARLGGTYLGEAGPLGRITCTIE